ncbi:GntR family transcriptional regulator [Roseitranquillus sediminis]|uniref:GntR family transcriptional regulator n=1 Tax=Roseitranquillus sediminis TaxID=2809051 RepID=UPI001D0C5ACA|nr:GntR family transcriptional regulator [Roseitranquillus sediminis]MBM9595417.1 GntR family transcriptional regulator [Roseitranquillus sediminis]
MGATPRSDDATRAVRQALEIDIVVGRIYPRERLVEEQLVERFSISRHVVRRVLADLESDGLVVRSAGRGVVVAEYSSAEVRELYDMRAFLEREAALRIPAKVPDDALAEIGAVLAAWTEAAEAGDLLGIVSNNKTYHEKIYALCGNRFLAMGIHQFAKRANLVRFSASTEPDFVARTRREHDELFELLQSSDRQRLAELCVAHIMPAAELYIARRRQIEGVAARGLGLGPQPD